MLLTAWSLCALQVTPRDLCLSHHHTRYGVMKIATLCLARHLVYDAYAKDT